MLQFIVQTNDRYSIEETAQIAIEGGCRWIQLHLPDLTDSEIKSIAPSLIELCRETAVFLLIEDRPELAKELGLHGIHITLSSSLSPAALREELGPEAVIGVDVSTSQAIIDLRNADIDYVSISSELGIEKISDIIEEVRKAEIEIPVVVTGDISPEDAVAYIAVGASGIATSKPLIESKDPVRETEIMIHNLSTK